MRMALIEWIDTYADAGWMKLQAVDNIKPCNCIAVGLVKEYPTYFNVLQLCSSHKDVDMVSAIDKRCITRIRYLRVKK